LVSFDSFIISFSLVYFFFSSRRRHTRSKRDWSSDVCSSDLAASEDDRARRREHGDVQRGVGRVDDDVDLDPLVERRGTEVVTRRSEERRVGKEWRNQWSADV